MLASYRTILDHPANETWTLVPINVNVSIWRRWSAESVWRAGWGNTDQNGINIRSSSDPDATLLLVRYGVTPPRALSGRVHPIRSRPFDVLLVRRM